MLHGEVMMWAIVILLAIIALSVSELLQKIVGFIVIVAAGLLLLGIICGIWYLALHMAGIV